MPTTSNRATIDIESAGAEVVVNAEGRTVLEIAIRGDGAADYRLDGREDVSQAWVETPTTYTGSADYDATVTTGWTQLRLVCTTGTATADHTAEVVLCAGGK